MTTATIVSAFYPLSKSKHGVRKYLEWIRNFCQIPRPMVLFTDTKTAPLLERIRDPSITRVITKEFDTFTLTSSTWMERWQHEHSRDPEAAIHSPELYAIWAIKQECVSLAIAENPFNHDWFVWCDIGIQRHTDKQHLYMTFTDAIPDVCIPNTIHFLEVEPIPDQFARSWGQVPMIWPPPPVTLGGGCIVGNRTAWESFSREYVGMLEKFRSRNWFSGKDQIVFFAMLMEKVMPFRLFHATRTTSTMEMCDHWISFPIILGGQASVVIDARFI